LKWSEPVLVEVLGRYLDAFGPFMKYFPNAAGSVITKLFELLTSLPFAVKVSLIILRWNIFKKSVQDMPLSKCLLGRIPQQVVLGMQDCTYVPHLFALPKLLIKAFCHT